MANDINHVTIIGRTTRDLELRYTPAGTAVASFSIANGKSYTVGTEKKEQVSYFDVTVWGKLAEVMTEWVKEGQQLCIEGRLQQTRWDDQDGKKRSKVEIILSSFQFLGGKKDGGEGQTSSEPSPQGAAGKVNEGFRGEDVPNYEDNPFSDEDIPF